MMGSDIGLSPKMVSASRSFAAVLEFAEEGRYSLSRSSDCGNRTDLEGRNTWEGFRPSPFNLPFL